VALAPGGSLARNSDFALRWVKSDSPDCWAPVGAGWEGEVVALQVGRSYRLSIDYLPRARGEVVLRWSREVAYDLPQNVKLPKIENRPIRPDHPEMTFTASESMALLQVTIRGARPEDVCRKIELIEWPADLAPKR